MVSATRMSRRINLNFADFLVFVCVEVAEIACMMMVSKDQGRTKSYQVGPGEPKIPIPGPRRDLPPAHHDALRRLPYALALA